MPGSGVNNHPGWFVDHDQFLILENNIERDVFCNQTHRVNRWNPNGDPLTTAQHLTTFFGRQAINFDKTIQD